MATCCFRDSTVIGDYLKPYIVAEVNSAHSGNLDAAFEMILKAKEIGVDCVKFQSWSAETLYCKTYYDKNPIAKRIVSKFSFSEAQLLEVSRFCKQQKIACASTPYSRQEVDFLLEFCDVPFIKIASMELNNHSYLEYIAKSGAPIVLSTGMGDIEEIRKAVDVIKNSGNKELCLLHCVSIYPADISITRLNNILGLREEFQNCAIGFSDHSLGIELATASIALGAAMLEKHFTLDRRKIGMDNQMATEPGEFLGMIRACHNVFHAMGGKDRIVFSEEFEQRKVMRRSVVAARVLTAGSIISSADLELKRPGDGIPPEKLDELIGRVLKKDIGFDTMIYESDFVE